MSDPAPIYLCLPTRDGTAQVRSLEAFHYLALSVRRPLLILMAEASNIPRARNGIHDGLRQLGIGRTQKVWWMDSDIRFDAGAVEHLAAMMRIGDEAGRHVLVAAHYRMVDGRFQGLRHREGDEHVEPAPEGAVTRSPKGATGFGLVYGATDPAYVWHADAEGEDIHWWRDHPAAEVWWYEPWRPAHQKVVSL